MMFFHRHGGGGGDDFMNMAAALFTSASFAVSASPIALKNTNAVIGADKINTFKKNWKPAVVAERQ